MHVTETATLFYFTMAGARAARRPPGPLVGWLRYVLDHHTPAQTLAGALVGSIAPLFVFHRMRLA
jgi:hypothetical protein